MNHAAGRAIVGLSLAVLFAASACGKSSSPPATGGGTGGQTGGGSGGSTGGGPLPAGCTSNSIKIVFDPMYSAFVPNHSFKVPVVVVGVDQAAVDWRASDPAMVDVADDPATGGAMLTMQKAGTVDIIASMGTTCGVAALTITGAEEADYMAGAARYNDGVTIRVPPRGGMGAPVDAGDDASDAANPREAACTNCHGDTANGPYKTVQHTPEQAAGFSDAQLKDIFMNAMVPTGGYFDTKIVSYRMWQSFHRWQMTDDEAKGIIVYLRSLAPAAQTGAPNFGNAFDGGIPDGGGRRRDGGGGERPPREAGGGPVGDAAADTASD